MAKISAYGDCPLHRFERGNGITVTQVVLTKMGRVLRKRKLIGGSWSGYRFIRKIPPQEIPEKVRNLKLAGWVEVKT